MTVTYQVIILALLITCVLSIVIGYLIAQKRFQQQEDVLQQKSQDRLKATQTAHEQRLQDALFQARQDYEAQLAQRIGHYQDQFDQSLSEREQEHQTRLEVWQQGFASSSGQPNHAAAGGTAVGTSPEVLQLKHQYEARLKEAAQKLQQAYEQQLAQRAKATTADLQQAYETKLAQQIEHYEAHLAQRVTQLEAEFAARQDAMAADVTTGVSPVEDSPAQASEVEVSEFPQASPSEIMGTSNNEPTITLHRPFSPIGSDPSPSPAKSLDFDTVDSQGNLPSASDHRYREDEPSPAPSAAEQIIADLAELEEMPQLPNSDPFLDQLDDLPDLPPGEPVIEIEQLDDLDLDDISQLS